MCLSTYFAFTFSTATVGTFKPKASAIRLACLEAYAKALRKILESGVSAVGWLID